MEPAEPAGDESGNPEEFELLDFAAQRSELPIPVSAPETGSLGEGSAARFIASMLANAGIVVEHLGEDINEDERPYEFMQIIDDESMKLAMDVNDYNEVKLFPPRFMHGFQLKLSGDHHWKVKVHATARVHHNIHQQRHSRGGANADSIHEYTNHNLHEIFLPNGGQMWATIAASNAISISVLFEYDTKNKECTWNKYSLPPIYQRRIDMLFHNKYCARLQVRSMCHVLCSTCSRSSGRTHMDCLLAS
jgi:hypothetical protein